MIAAVQSGYRRGEEPVRLLVEGFFAVRAAEVVDRALVERLVARGGGIDHHSAYGVLFLKSGFRAGGLLARAAAGAGAASVGVFRAVCTISARMLTAISSGETAPMASPAGTRTFSSRCAADPSPPRNPANSFWALVLLATNAT